MTFVPLVGGAWNNAQNLGPKSYTCYYCGQLVATTTGFSHGGVYLGVPVRIALCNNCSHPTYFYGPVQIPGVPVGRPVAALPKDVETLYNEARVAAGSECYTSAVMLCRKILAHIAVDQGAGQNLTFQDYVDYLATKGYVPPKCKALVDHIRTKGNEANHDIVLMTKADALDLITFLEMLLKFIYEFPAMTPAARATP